MGFEPTRGDPNGLAVHRLNHSATSSEDHLYISANDIAMATLYKAFAYSFETPLRH